MKFLFAKLFLCVLCALCTCEKWEDALLFDNDTGDEDTIIVQASDENDNSHSSRFKRQAYAFFDGFPGGSFLGRQHQQIGGGGFNFGNFPGFPGNNLGGGGGGGGSFGGLPGFAGFQLPGFGGGGIPQQQFPQQLPQQQQQQQHVQISTTTTKPVKPVQSSCFTNNGEEGECNQFNKCYPLLFGSAEAELMNPGLAYSLKSSAGHCASSDPISNDIFYNYAESYQSKQICCAKPGSHVPESKYPKLTTTTESTNPTPKPPFHQQNTQRTTSRPAWPPMDGSWQQPTAATHPPWQQPTAATHPWQQPTAATHPPWQQPTAATHPWQRPTAATSPPSWQQQPTAATHPPLWQQQPTAATHPPSMVGQHSQHGKQQNCAGFYIIGGVPVQGRTYPWIASVKDGLSNRHVCGGSLVSGRSVLTAAHCVKQLGPQQIANLRVYLGVNDISGSHNHNCVVVRKVKNIRYHRGFSMRTLHDDIALLTLDSAVPVGGNIQTVSLSSSRVGDAGQATVAGWGGVYLGGSPVGQLRHVNLDIVRNEVCASRYVGSAPAGITNNMMCAGSAGRDACLGDSGGPLHMNGQQIGIVSFGTGCGTLPGVYTRVASYLPWIHKNMAN